MIISKDTNPERDFYYLGAKIIEVLSQNKSNKIHFINVFEELRISENISVNLFTLTLDWLYLIGAIHKPERGYIVKCF